MSRTFVKPIGYPVSDVTDFVSGYVGDLHDGVHVGGVRHVVHVAAGHVHQVAVVAPRREAGELDSWGVTAVDESLFVPEGKCVESFVWRGFMSL